MYVQICRISNADGASADPIQDAELPAAFISTRPIMQCRACRKQCSFKTGTIFEDSPLGLDKWHFWALFKRCIKGTHIQLSPFHLQRYVDEEVFRFNQRKLDDARRFGAVMMQVPGRRITYRRLTQQDGAGFMGLE